jgi:tetratricopeptide (TPR) repeat protein
MVKLCLNMIVKNESRIIQRLLASVVGLIDTYCICDTGSTDNTIELITEFFNEKGKQGKVIVEPFRDFGYNRSFALKACESMDADYILLLDADMVLDLKIPADQFKNMLKECAYHFYQGSSSFYHKNVRLVKNHIGISYWGVTHEYVALPKGVEAVTLQRDVIFINDIGDGGAKADKYERDVRLLKKGLEENPNNDRYTFYLANSYMNMGDYHNAIEAYKQRIKIGGWFEEVWYSYYNIGNCYKKLKDMPNAIYYWLEGYQYFPKRIDNLYEMIHYYREEGKNNLAYMYYVAALQQVLANPNADYLFMKKSIYDYELDYEMSIIGYYCNPNNFYDLTKISCKVLNCAYIPEWIRRNVLSNYKFYSKKLVQYDDLSDGDRQELQSIGKMRGDIGADFVSSTPTMALVDSGSRLVVGTRYVNYRINDKGGYENKDRITTINVVKGYSLKNANHYTETSPENKTTFELVAETETILGYNTELDGVPYVGVEDVRFHYTGDKLLYNGNRGLGPHSITIEHGVADYGKLFCEEYMDILPTTSALAYKSANGVAGGDPHPVEKNWVLFQGRGTGGLQHTKCIYKWYPLTVGDLVEKEVEIGYGGGDQDQAPESVMDSIKEYEYKTTHEIDSPALFRVFRGSTNGVMIYNRTKSRHEVWFLCHVVSYEDRRYYYHAFVSLDPATYTVLGYTPMFTFEGQKVEYTLGFVCIRDKLLIGYSVMDRETKYMTVSVSQVLAMMHEKI